MEPPVTPEVPKWFMWGSGGTIWAVPAPDVRVCVKTGN
jgi:hypothetical protein